MSKELIRLRNIRMAFDDEVVLNDLNLYINDKEFLTLLGPSGCGKTTTLRIIGGFTTPVSGDVLFDGVRMFSSLSSTSSIHLPLKSEHAAGRTGFSCSA